MLNSISRTKYVSYILSTTFSHLSRKVSKCTTPMYNSINMNNIEYITKIQQNFKKKYSANLLVVLQMVFHFKNSHLRIRQTYELNAKNMKPDEPNELCVKF